MNRDTAQEDIWMAKKHVTYLFSIISHEGNVNSKHPTYKTIAHVSEGHEKKRRKRKTSKIQIIGEATECLELSHIAAENAE